MILTIILLVVSFSAYASMGTILFHFNNSWFSTFKNERFWNPRYSHGNKWKNNTKEQGEAFLFSSTLLVFLTDGYHRMQFIFENSLFLAFSTYSNNFKWYWSFIGIRVIYAIVFNLMFDKILIKK